jgi:L,D-peptidoglycan transpeptidase YkuD (ErfK/YbiS/YcfS/YnhG family)
MTPPAYLNDLMSGPVTSKQVVDIKPSGTGISKATLTAWTYNNGNWHKSLGPWPAVVGRNGFAKIDEKKEGDGKTPSGIYPIGIAFGKSPRIKTGLTYRQATADDLWVDDVKSPQYNQWVSAPTLAASFESMLRTDGLYDMGAVIEYNTSPVVPGNGSAIFIHIWRDHGRKATAGCVALNKEHVRKLLAWLQNTSDPKIILGDHSLIFKGR